MTSSDLHVVGSAEELRDVQTAFADVGGLARDALTAVLGRGLDSVTTVIATTQLVEEWIDIPAVADRLREAQRAAGMEDDLQRAEIELELHLLGVALQWPAPRAQLAIAKGEPVMVLDAERFVRWARKLAVPLDALVLVVVLHELVHLSKRHVSISRGGEAVGGWDAEVEAQALAHEALLRLMHRNDEDSALARDALRAMYQLSEQQAAPYRAFRASASALSPDDLARPGAVEYVLGVVSDDLQKYLLGPVRLEARLALDTPPPRRGDVLVLHDDSQHANRLSGWVAETPTAETSMDAFMAEYDAWLAQVPQRGMTPVVGPLSVTAARREADSDRWILTVVPGPQSSVSLRDLAGLRSDTGTLSVQGPTDGASEPMT